MENQKVSGQSRNRGSLEFKFYLVLLITLGSAFFISYYSMGKSGSSGPGQLYANYSFCQWLFLLFWYFLAKKEAQSALKGGIDDFWLDEEETEFFLEMQPEDGSEDKPSFFADLPLKRRREALIHYGFYKAFWPAWAAWLVGAVAAGLYCRGGSLSVFLELPAWAVAHLLPIRPFSPGSLPISLNEVLAVVTAANLAALAVGGRLFLKNRRLADRLLPVPPPLTIENVGQYHGRSHL